MRPRTASIHNAYSHYTLVGILGKTNIRLILKLDRYVKLVVVFLYSILPKLKECIRMNNKIACECKCALIFMTPVYSKQLISFIVYVDCILHTGDKSIRS